MSPRVFLLTINMCAGGGAERQIARLLASGKAEAIIALQQGDDYAIPPGQLQVLTNHDQSVGPIRKIFSLPLYAWRLSRLLPRDADVTVMSFMERPNYVNVLAALISKHRTVINLQVHVFSHYSSPIKRINLWLIRLLYPRADLVTANSALTLSDLSRTLGLPDTQCHVIPNVYDGEALNESAAEPLPAVALKALEGSSLLSTGRLAGQKAPWRLLRIFSELHSHYPSTKLVVLNDGDLREQSVTMARALGLRVWSVFEQPGDVTLDTLEVPDEDYDVWFLGLQKNPYAFFARCTISLHPSLYEGLPNALIEAMTVGACCVASDCPSGPREILAPASDVNEVASVAESEGSGLLLPAFDAVDEPFVIRPPDATERVWVESIGSLLDVPQRIVELGEGARLRASYYALDKLDTHLEGVL